MAALELCRTLYEGGIRARRLIEPGVWTNEEGTCFTPVIEGSGVFAGKFTPEYARTQRDAEGISCGDALAAIGYNGDAFRVTNPPEPVT